jgi:hypothetical protein
MVTQFDARDRYELMQRLEALAAELSNGHVTILRFGIGREDDGAESTAGVAHACRGLALRGVGKRKRDNVGLNRPARNNLALELGARCPGLGRRLSSVGCRFVVSGSVVAAQAARAHGLSGTSLKWRWRPRWPVGCPKSCGRPTAPPTSPATSRTPHQPGDVQDAPERAHEAVRRASLEVPLDPGADEHRKGGPTACHPTRRKHTGRSTALEENTNRG